MRGDKRRDKVARRNKRLREREGETSEETIEKIKSQEETRD